MPPRVYRGKSKYEYHPKEGGSISLCRLDASEAEVWQAYSLAKKKKSITVRDLQARYFASPEYVKGKSAKTKTLHASNWKALEPVFGNAEADKVEPKHVRKYMDIRGEKHRVSANRERTLLKSIFAYGYERGMVSRNPCEGVKAFIEAGRDHYVSDEEYAEVYDNSPPMIQVFMELAYICAARGQDVRKILLSDIKPEGLFVMQAKTGKKQIKLWNDRLRAVVAQAQRVREERLQGKHASIYLIVTEQGGPYSASGLVTLWRDNRLRIEKALEKKFDWTFHDLKAKGISDYEGDKQAFSGHKSRSMMERYNRSPDKVDVIDFKRDIRK